MRSSGVAVQLCGDAHLSNFGLFASPERSLVFDLNDFDETLAGPWEWDLKRLVASLEVLSRSRGFDAGGRGGGARMRRGLPHADARVDRVGRTRDVVRAGRCRRRVVGRYRPDVCR